MKFLSGSDVVPFIKERQAKQVRNLRQTWQTVPRLAVVQTVDDPVIDTYVRLKRRYAEDILIEFEHVKVEQSEALTAIDQLNKRDDVLGVIVQLPLADMSEATTVLNAVDPAKDVDGLNEKSLFDPATPIAINWLLAAHDVEMAGKTIAIVGQGRLVGSPLAKMWQDSGYQVTVFDKSSGDISGELQQSDIIVTAAGSPGVVSSSMIKSGAVVVDAGTTSEANSVVGDLAKDVYQRKDIKLTPEKGGVGPLTVAALFENVILASRKAAQKTKTQ